MSLIIRLIEQYDVVKRDKIGYEAHR